jgi:hypothetical protein
MMGTSGQARARAGGMFMSPDEAVSKKVLLMSGNTQPADSAAAAADQPGGPAEPATSGAALPPGAAPPESGTAPPGSGGPSAYGGARRAGSVLTSRAAGWLAAAALAGALVAVSVTGLTTPSVTGLVAPSAARIAVGVPPGAFRQVRVVPAGGLVRFIAPQAAIDLPGRIIPGGPVLAGPFGQVAAGTVSSVSASGFTLTTGAGQHVTVTEKPSTTYRKAGGPATASAVTRGAAVAVLGSQHGLNMTATVVAVLPAAP